MITKSGYATKKANVTQEKVNSYRQLLNEPAQEETSTPVAQEQVKPVNIRDLSVSNVLPKPKVNISAGEVKPLNIRNFVNEINNTPEAKRANLTVQTDSLKKQINTKEQEYARANNISDWNTKRQEQSRIQQELNSLREQLDSKNKDLVMLGGYNLLSGEQVEQFNKNAPLTQKIDKALKYDIPTTAKKVGRTAMDLAMQIPTAAYDVYEGALDATVANVGAIGSTIADKTGNKDIANKIREGATKFVNITPSSKPLVEEAKNKGEGIYEPKVLGIKVRDALYSISNMITAAYSGGLPMMALSASGQNIEEALTDNQSLERAVAYGDISGAIEGLTEKMFDAVKIVGGGKFDKFLPKSAIGKLIGGSAGEGIEEIISNGLNPLVKQLTYEKGTYDLPEFWDYVKMLGESFWNGAVIGAIMKGGQDISTPQFREQYKQDVYTAVDKSKLPDNIKEQVKEAMLTPAQAQINQDLGMIRNSADYQRTQQTNMLPTYSQIQQANLAQNQVNQQQNIETQQTIQPQIETAQKGEIQMPTAKTNAVYNTAKKLNVDVQLANRVMDMAKLTEVPVNGFVDVNENIDGYYKDGAIYINKNSKKAQDRIFVHELTHNIEKADGWQGLRDTIFNSNVLYNELAEKGQTLEEYRQLIKDTYAENEIQLNEDDIDREVIAKFAEEHLLKDQKSIDRMVQENPTFMQRVKNFIDDLVVKFKGTAEEKELLRIQRMYDKAFAESKQVETSKTQKVQYGINDTVPKGYTRLYRGLNQEFDRNYDKKKIDNVNGYESWTDNYDLAKEYGDNVYYIDIPTSEIKDSIIDENPQSETYGDRNLMYVHDKKVGLKGESGKEYMLYTGHDNYANLEYKKADAPSETSYSINTDNQGRQLSKQQQEYFKDSKVRDENGKLIPVYHGTKADFNVFTQSEEGALGKGIYFAESYDYAKGFGRNGKVVEAYVNIKNPYVVSWPGNYNQEELKTKGYDGIYHTGNKFWVAFEPNQIKNVDNLNPTENEDIRYSVETREVDFPEKVGDRYLSRHAKTLAESGVTMPETVDLIEKMVKDGSLTHERITDKKALAYAEKYIEENGFKDAVDHWNHLTKSNRELSKEELALGQLIFNTADTNQDVQLVKKMIADLVVKGTQAGRSLQAMSMVKKMTPDGRLYSLERTVQKLNQDLREQFGKDFKDIEIPDDLAEKLLKSKTTKETDAAVEEIQQYIADRVPATWGDKANAWRYLAMLGNPRTHIRNVLGNAVFIPAVEIKNLIATGIEKTLPKAERTKAVVGFKDTDLLNFAESDFDTHQEAVRGENKYDITAGVQEKQRVFNNKVLETLRKKNFELLEKEDATFLKYHYKRAMASALKARGITLKELRSGTPEAIKKLDEVRQYAINEAQKATYRDFNSMANAVSSIKRKLKRASGSSKAAKVGSMVAEGIIPFTKTPANILKRGIEYSPVGLGKGIYDAMIQVKKGNVTASQAIDEMAAGLTGTGIVMLGALLKSLGLIVGGDEEKQKEQNFEKLKGNQNYALKIGNKTYTIDWMAPSSMPLFVGVEVVDLLQGENISDIIGSIGNITEPVFELSMLQGLNSTMNTLGSDNPLWETFKNTVESYFAQYNPTFLGQIARTIDPKRRTTYADKNSIVPSGIQTFAQKQLQKIPFASKTLPTYKDQFGRESVTENVVERIFSNFLSPGYLADVKDQPVENELTKLYEKTGESAILPSYASKSITVDKQKKNLTAKEYDTFAKVRGNVAYDNLEKLMTSQEYKSMDNEQKIKAIKKIYDYANSVGKSKVSDYELTKSEQQIQDYEKAGIDYYKWLILQDKADTNKNGYVTKDEMNKALNKSSLTSTQKALIKKDMNKSK